MKINHNEKRMGDRSAEKKSFVQHDVVHAFDMNSSFVVSLHLAVVIREWIYL